MSTIVTEKRICDRCKKELKYPLLKMIVRRPILSIVTRWTDGSPYGYADGYRELCKNCEDEFYKFMRNNN